MPTVLKGLRASQMLQWARSRLFFMASQPAQHLKSVIGLPGGIAIAGKSGPYRNIFIDYPDPYIVFMKLDADTSVLPRYIGRAAELFEDAVGTLQTPNQSAAVPFYCYAAPHHIGGGFWTNPLYDANPVLEKEMRLNPPTGVNAFKLVAGIAVFSKHPIRKWVPYSAYAQVPQGSPALPFIGVCPLGERTPGVFEFLFHIGQINADPIAVKTDTNNLTAGSGSTQALPVAPAGAVTLFCPHWCPIARGEAAYVQVFTDPIYTPRAVYLRDWGASVSVQSILDIDPVYEPGTLLYEPMPPNRTSFARLANNKLMFIYFNDKHSVTRLFVSSDEGGTWSAVSAPLDVANWINHTPIGFTVGGPSLLTPLGENAMMFSTFKETIGTFHTWYTLDGCNTWSEMPYASVSGKTRPAAGPMVIQPYVSVENKGELAMLVRDPLDGSVSIYVSLDLGAEWQYRGPAVFPPAVDDPFGFNQHTAYVGTYDMPSSIIAGRPGMMEIV